MPSKMQPVSIDALASLLRNCEQFAHQRIAESGGFHPFGAFINRAGDIEALGAQLSAEPRDSFEVYEFLEGAIAEMAHRGDIRAYALAANVAVPQQLASPFPDGLRVHVEAPGYSRFVYTPYRLLPYRAIRRFLAVLPTVEYSDPIAVDLRAKVFSETPS
ncbi:MAG: hypothetical protein ACK520_08730 [Inhella sp.]|uniref:hypothetical protein n=1 Tax=Inhella sp. TaxID=1921806 RepID=UPI0022BAC417|nr:hypothetical protein [Inhella sp.]MCZ8235008.1 hypothetical protein [Inhella sp.]